MPVRARPRRTPCVCRPGSFRVEPLAERTVPSANPTAVDDTYFTASVVGTATVVVAPVNDPPTAIGDQYATDEDKALAVTGPGVLANDGDPLTAVVVDGPAHGTLNLRPDGSFRYVPDKGFSGTDTFTYVARDPSGAESAPATVTITVTRVDHRPVAKGDRYTTAQDTPLRVAAAGILANDTDPDGDRLSAVLVSGPAHGTLTLRANGSFRYVPDAGFAGTDSFTYRASDGSLSSRTVRVTIKVLPAGPKTTPDPPPVPPPTGGGTGPTGSGSGGTSKSAGGSTSPAATTVSVLSAPPILTEISTAFGNPGLTAYVASAPAPPPVVAAAPTPIVVVPTLPPPPTVPFIPPPVRVDAPPPPVVVAPLPAGPDVPIVPPVPQLQPDNPVFGGLDELSHDVGQGQGVTAVTGTVVGTGVVATAGYVLLSPRLAYWLLSALLARRTVWKPFDPLEVVYAWEREKGLAGADDDSLANMVDSDTAEPKA